MKEKIVRWIVWRLPRIIIEWATIRLIEHATQGFYGNTLLTNLTAMEALCRWDTCGECGQTDMDQTGEYPCKKCGLPTTWDELDCGCGCTYTEPYGFVPEDGCPVHDIF